MVTTTRIAIVLGSGRGANSNGNAVASYVTQRLQRRLDHFELSDAEIDVFEPVTRFKLPFPFAEPVPPKAAGTHGQAYESSAANEWSRYVKETDAILIVTPEWNGLMPSSLKLAIEYLGLEWSGKKIGVVSYGGPRLTGGESCQNALKTALVDDLKADYETSRATIKLDGKYILGPRLTTEEAPIVLAQYDTVVDETIDKLLAKL